MEIILNKVNHIALRYLACKMSKAFQKPTRVGSKEVECKGLSIVEVFSRVDYGLSLGP